MKWHWPWWYVAFFTYGLFTVMETYTDFVTPLVVKQLKYRHYYVRVWAGWVLRVHQ